MGLKALAAVGACATGFITYLWLTDAGPGAESRAQVAAHVVTTATDIQTRHNNLVALQAYARRIAPQRIGSETTSATSPFADRFAVNRSGSSAAPEAPFADRFNGRESSGASFRSAAVAARTTGSVAPRGTTRAAAAKTAPRQATQSGFQLASASDTPVVLAYAPADSAADAGMPGALRELTPRDPLTDVDPSRTAIYDISAGTVYLPNGRRLEAHSGLGGNMDDPRSAAMRNAGVTPPNVYDLRMREARFHGVRAIRLIPRDESKMYGRSGILAHTFMLGPNGQSNGCVSFKDYQAFLDAYDRGDITRLVVVERLTGEPPSARTAADWVANKLRNIFPGT